MPQNMPDLATRYRVFVNESLVIVSSTEALWITAPPASAVRQQLKVGQLEALYESVFLRIFSAWEGFLEEALTRFVAGYRTPSHSPVVAAGAVRHRTVSSARAALYGGRTFLLWHDPKQVVRRSQGLLVQCPVETVLQGAQAQLERYAAIRHRIAHSTDDASQKFRQAAQSIAGVDHRGKPGRLLRSADISDPLNPTKWIRRISDDLIALSQAVTA